VKQWLFLFFLLATWGTAHAIDCDGDRHFNPRSIFHVTTTPVRVRYFHNYSTAQIEGMRNMKFANKLEHNPGLTMAEHSLKMDYQVGGLEHPNHDGFCVWLESVNVDFSYVTLDVYVSSQYPEGTCPYQVILNHENHHVSIDQRVLAKYRARIDWVLKHNRSIPTRRHPMTVVSMENGKAILSAKLNAIVDAVTRDYQKEITRQNGKIDTPAAYKRTQSLCNNW